MRSCATAISRYTNSAMAPEELTRKRNTVSGESQAMIVERKPMVVVSRIALTGTPRELTSSRPFGASPRRARANSMREPV